MNQVEQKRAAKAFVQRWIALPCVEEEHSRSFWIELLQNVLGIADATHVLEFERKVKGRKIDVFYEDMGILVEMKSRGICLDESSVRSKKVGLETPFDQAKWYADNLPHSIRPRWIITCNFDEMRIYDLDRPDEDYVSILLNSLPDQLYLLSFFTDRSNSRLVKEMELSVQAGELVGKLYDELAKQYLDLENSKHEQYSLNVVIVRLVFLLYAEDAGLLNRHGAFFDYMRAFDARQSRQALIDLFKVLNTPEDQRDPYLDDVLKAFPYANGGLFADESIVVPQLTDEIRVNLLINASASFDWSGISPTIFGAVFESTLNPQTRRSGGMHYTSIENIHKVIDPLFLGNLKEELARIEGEKIERKRKMMLKMFQRKLANIKVFDPACGSGNFLTETYICLRRLENRVLSALNDGQSVLGLNTAPEDTIMVGINQLYGIEINDFAVAVAKTALWIAESQAMAETEDIVRGVFDFFPLKNVENIRQGNALRMDWNEVLLSDECSYIVGNPPFYGAKLQSPEQRADLIEVFRGAKNCGTVDYVSGWYVKAAEYLRGGTRAAFVSTNSICQGEQVASIWTPVFKEGVRIDFAHDTFRWRNEASAQAHVFVIIVGFSKCGTEQKTLFHHPSPDEEALVTHPENINAYLSPAPDVFIWNRTTPLCDVPAMGIGNKPIDGGNYIFTDEERDEFLAKEPGAAKFMHPYLGSKEFINGSPRTILYLGNASEEELDDLPLCRERIEAVRQYRLSSSSKPTQKLASRPRNYHVENMPEGNSILVPETSSERREYIPMGFVGPETLCSNAVKLIPDASLYHFGVLQSQFHNAWMRRVAGRLKSDYRYSAGVVYNNFVWPDPTHDQRAEIERCAQQVLDRRQEHSDKTLADLYDPKNMPAGLRRAHKLLDQAVEAAYGVDFAGNEDRIVSHLFSMYSQLGKEGEDARAGKVDATG